MALMTDPIIQFLFLLLAVMAFGVISVKIL